MSRTEAPHSAKKPLPKQKPVRELAKNDYVDPERGDTFNDSDILAGQGVTARNSNNESREEKRQRTMAEAERDASSMTP